MRKGTWRTPERTKFAPYPASLQCCLSGTEARIGSDLPDGNSWRDGSEPAGFALED
ncbi:hypothetical protein OBBRIDRAFT_790528 [Obba rivulosa]|uniref:Uncharacterized protein n=1 Tax=Obba rivulosa TaxID=1052685 RepID=A0A8E2DP68_9APHY|nr:hypothetical protein OBBRIDRAFT_790528 [Obba rivulosa]